MKESFPHERDLRKGRVSIQGAVYFLTTCTMNKVPLLTQDHQIPGIIINSLKWFDETKKIHLLGFVIMPDHLHFAAALREEVVLESLMHSLKSFTAHEINKLLARTAKVWQPKYYDHCLRTEEDFKASLRYMHENPVRRGFVENPEDYPWSTANPKYEDMIKWEYF